MDVGWGGRGREMDIRGCVKRDVLSDDEGYGYSVVTLVVVYLEKVYMG